MAKAPAEKASASQILQQNIDLSAKVKESSYVGFSAANGGANGFTTLYEWQFSSSPADAGTPLPPNTSSQQNPPPGLGSNSDEKSKSKDLSTRQIASIAVCVSLFGTFLAAIISIDLSANGSHSRILWFLRRIGCIRRTAADTGDTSVSGGGPLPALGIPVSSKEGVQLTKLAS